MRRQLTSATIDETVREVLSELEADSAHGEMAIGILDAWHRRVTDRRSQRGPFDDSVLRGSDGAGVAEPKPDLGIERRPLDTGVPVSCGGNLTPRSGGRRSSVWMTFPRRMRGRS